MPKPDIDKQFFADHPDRKLHIRKPQPGESEAEFRSLGPHQKHRRRIIVSRVDPAMAGFASRHGVDLMRVPFLLFADETVEDTDEVLRPVFDEIMRDAAASYGMSI